MSTRKTFRTRPGKASVRRGHRPDALTSAFDLKAKWRTLRADQFDAVDLKEIDELLDRAVIFGRTDWNAAVKGDIEAALRLVIGFMPVAEITVQIDLAMTAMLRLALGGNSEAAAALSLVVSHLPGRFALHREISQSWMIRNVLAAYGKSRHRLPAK